MVTIYQPELEYLRRQPRDNREPRKPMLGHVWGIDTTGACADLLFVGLDVTHLSTVSTFPLCPGCLGWRAVGRRWGAFKIGCPISVDSFLLIASDATVFVPLQTS